MLGTIRSALRGVINLIIAIITFPLRLIRSIL